MQETKFNSNNKYKEIRTNKKDKQIIKTISNNKMISICKDNSKVKCMISKKTKINKINNKENKYPISKWVQQTIRKNNKI